LLQNSNLELKDLPYVAAVCSYDFKLRFAALSAVTDW